MPPRFQTYTCAVEPRMRSRSSCCKPVMIASAITSAMTPTVTPSVETSEMTEMNTWRRLARRYRSAIWTSKGAFIENPELRTKNEERRTRNEQRRTRKRLLEDASEEKESRHESKASLSEA